MGATSRLLCQANASVSARIRSTRLNLGQKEQRRKDLARWLRRCAVSSIAQVRFELT